MISSDTKILDKIKKELGVDPEAYMKDIIMSEDYAIFPISPNLDISCGGGIVEGTTTIISGPQKLGKSTFCLQVAANAQNIDDGVQRKIYYFDIENKLLRRDVEGIHNLKTDLENFEPVGSREGKVLNSEDIFKLIENIVKVERNAIIILDSLSMLLSKAEQEYEFDSGKSYMANVPRQTAIFFRKMSQVIRPTKNTLLCILHDYANIGSPMPNAPKKAESGGTKVQYASNYKFKLTHKKDLKASASDESKIGHEVFFKCDHNPLNVPPSQGSFFHLFGYGIDDVTEYLELAKSVGIVKASGAWINFPDGQKAQGKIKARELLLKDANLYSMVVEAVKDIIRPNLQEEVIDEEEG